VFTYNTVRAGGAALTAFLLCLIFGPMMIRWLRAVKAGQFIREDHVADLHALHKSKAGTPTMGGALIVSSAVVSLALWGDWSSRLLDVALIILVAMAALGFLDDYTKLRRKHNDGLSARAKFTGQIIIGLLLGIYLVQSPIAVSATYISPRTVEDWPALLEGLSEAAANGKETPAGQLWPNMTEASRRAVQTLDNGLAPDETTQRVLTDGINRALGQPDAFDRSAWEPSELTQEGQELFLAGSNSLNEVQRLRLNRLLLEASFPAAFFATAPNIHTKVNIPGFKNWLLPFGAFYAIFVMVLLVASSNAVNLTDGLDGLAIGASIMSILAYTGIAYIISRADWSQYLYLTYVPEAAELTVFGAALLGAGLGFLWYNAHPAEVFMGDTGSLALGGAIGAMAVLTKQELLLILVGGLFVLEAGSVILQVLSFKTRGKRIFKMAPLHHHFELLGWSENKVIVRFWILALLFALMSLGTLKLR
jgi:phospho-N-acetylmuramoyl-pentapeptide-transferase